jgi:hypothetical protein
MQISENRKGPQIYRGEIQLLAMATVILHVSDMLGRYCRKKGAYFVIGVTVHLLLLIVSYNFRYLQSLIL